MYKNHTKMPRYFPSKKVFVVGVLAIGLLAWSVVHTRTSQQNGTAISDNVLRTVASAEAAFSDSDGDGLYDWEEAFYRTDPDDRDSNNNGRNDEDENRNEKVYPEIIPISFDEQLGVNSGARVQNDNPDNLSKTLLTSAVSDYASLNGNPSSDVEQEIVNDLTSQIGNYEIETAYSKSDFKFADSDELNANNTYLVEFLNAISQNADIYILDALEIINSWESRSHEDNIELLSRIQASHLNLSKTLVSIRVPEEFSVQHVLLANIFHNSAKVLDDIKLFSTDPIKSMTAMAAYTQLQSDRADVMVNLTTNLGKILE